MWRTYDCINKTSWASCFFAEGLPMTEFLTFLRLATLTGTTVMVRVEWVSWELLGVMNSRLSTSLSLSLRSSFRKKMLIIPVHTRADGLCFVRIAPHDKSLPYSVILREVHSHFGHHLSQVQFLNDQPTEKQWNWPTIRRNQVKNYAKDLGLTISLCAREWIFHQLIGATSYK